MTEAVKVDAKEVQLTGEEKQFVSFIIGEETYGVPVLRVQEIIGISEITHVPKTLPFVKGVINLRGSVVPVIDMRKKFKMEKREYDATTVIVVVEINGRHIGMIVDSVSDVLNIPVRSIQDTPHFSAKIETDFIEAIGQTKDELVIILDVEKIITSDEIDDITFQRS